MLDRENASSPMRQGRQSLGSRRSNVSPPQFMNVTAEQLIEGRLTLPTLPHIVAKINALVDDPEVGTREIGMAVNEDAPIAAQVLRIANSAIYGLRTKVLSTEHATAVLGVRQLRSIALQASVIKHFQHVPSSPTFSLEKHWCVSILTGQMCSEMARHCRARIGLAPDEFHVVGLLLDVGRILMLEEFGDEYIALLEDGDSRGLSTHEAENEALGFDHAKVGGLIAAKWGLPASVISAIELHHRPQAELERDPIVNLVAHTSEMAAAIADGDLDRARETFGPRTMRSLGLRDVDVEKTLQAGCEALTHIQP